MSLEHWEHLKNDKFQARFKIVAGLIDTKDKTILDLNCGEPDFSRYTNHKRYICNDILPINNTAVEFRQVKDTEIDEPSDILVLFGHGCGEFTGVPQESKTGLESLKRNARHNPEYIVIEIAKEFFKKFKIEESLELEQYKKEYDIIVDVCKDGHYHDKRQIIIYKLKQ